jgi:putative hydrolase of HD superfamily
MGGRFLGDDDDVLAIKMAARLPFLLFFSTIIIFTATPTLAMSSSSSSSASSHNAKSAIDFLTSARGLKTTKRTGWVLQEASPVIESVADHSWRISLMSMVAAFGLVGDSSVDTNRCIRMALVHDLAEATVGDITPHCGVSDQDKHAQELAAMEQLTGVLVGLPNSNTTTTAAEEILSLWKEYEQGTSEEAKLVKDMDKLEMILQALEYEKDGQQRKSLDGFFDSTRDKWKTDIGRAWGQEIEARRNPPNINIPAQAEDNNK